MNAEDTWRVLVVDDDSDICRQIEEHYEGWKHNKNRLEIETMTDFSQAMRILELQRFDILVLDIFKGQAVEGGVKAGTDVLKEIKAKRFIPVIIYTALPASVRELENPLVKIAEKSGEAFSSLDEVVRGYLDIGIMRITRELGRHLDETLRSYLWDFVPAHWDEISSSGDDAALAYLICRRLAASFDITGAETFASRLKSQAPAEAPTVKTIAEGKVHPLRFYIIPPSAEGYRTGDILKTNGESGSFWLILTPWCDLTAHPGRDPNAEYVLLVHCRLLKEFEEYITWSQDAEPSRSKTEKLQRIVGTPHSKPEGKQEGRYHFLPGTLDLPDLVIDFQNLKTEPIGQLSDYTKIATLDSPFCESVVSCFIRFEGRVGTLDLDIEWVMQNLLAKRSA